MRCDRIVHSPHIPTHHNARYDCRINGGNKSTEWRETVCPCTELGVQQPVGIRKLTVANESLMHMRMHNPDADSVGGVAGGFRGPLTSSQHQ